MIDWEFWSDPRMIVLYVVLGIIFGCILGVTFWHIITSCRKRHLAPLSKPRDRGYMSDERRNIIYRLRLINSYYPEFEFSEFLQNSRASADVSYDRIIPMWSLMKSYEDALQKIRGWKLTSPEEIEKRREFFAALKYS